ncbi:hypothetical protein BN1723_020948, partial [Verticillium longisporum]
LQAHAPRPRQARPLRAGRRRQPAPADGARDAARERQRQGQAQRHVHQGGRVFREGALAGPPQRLRRAGHRHCAGRGQEGLQDGA